MERLGSSVNRTILAVVVLYVFLLACGGSARPSTTSLTAFPVPRVSPTVTSIPTITPKMAATAVVFYEKALALYQQGEEGDKYVQAIIDSPNVSLLQVYEASKTVAERWGQIRFAFYRMKRDHPQLAEAANLLSLSASYKEDAYRTLLRWTDTQQTSDLALYRKQMGDAQSAMLRAVAIIGSLGGLATPGPTDAPPQVDYKFSTTYTVQAGDTLSSIAKELGVTVADLAALNGIADPSRIYVGQVLKIPER